MPIKNMTHGQPFQIMGILCFKIDINHGLNGLIPFINTMHLDAVSYLPENAVVQLV